MQRSVMLRPWQRDALDAFQAKEPDTFLAVACPGAGKTTFALAAIRARLRGERRPIVVVVPTQHLKTQWAEAAARFGLHLDPNWSADHGRLPADMHGVVVTYMQAASSARELRRLAGDGFVVLDEIHHAASERAWGDGVAEAFAEADCRLLMSGTPFRTDDSPIPFVEYSFGDYGDALADYEYGYDRALEDGGVVRPVFFPRFDGHMEWVNADGEIREATFEAEIDRTEWGARLRTALSLDGQWLSTVIDRANQRLTSLRSASHPNAAGLIIAIDHQHARGIARLLKTRHGIDAKIALSDEPKASQIISRFAEGDDPWIVAVRMISEGVDIPRLRIGVFATTTSTAMFFRQAVGRITRHTAGLRSQRAYMYVPDDPRLRHHAITIAQQRRHSIEARRTRLAEDGLLDEVKPDAGAREQLSLFAPLSAHVTNEAIPDDGIDPDEDTPSSPTDLEGITIDLPPPPPLPGRRSGARPAGGAPAATRTAEKRLLRDMNSERVNHIARIAGLEHAVVNKELNHRASISRITEATVADLDTRLRLADRWIDQLTGPQ